VESNEDLFQRGTRWLENEYRPQEGRINLASSLVMEADGQGEGDQETAPNLTMNERRIRLKKEETSIKSRDEIHVLRTTLFTRQAQGGERKNQGNNQTKARRPVGI